jgi:hypothetical protein
MIPFCDGTALGECNTRMMLRIFRCLAFSIPRDLTPDPDAEPFPMYSFAPIRPEDPRMLIGSGPFAWRVIEVPDGSRVAYDALFLPGATEGLHPSEVVSLFAESRPRSDLTPTAG